MARMPTEKRARAPPIMLRREEGLAGVGCGSHEAEGLVEVDVFVSGDMPSGSGSMLMFGVETGKSRNE